MKTASKAKFFIEFYSTCLEGMDMSVKRVWKQDYSSGA